MKSYNHPETGENLFDMHKNLGAKGVPKFSKVNNGFKSKEPSIFDVVEGRLPSTHYNPDKLKYRMIEAGLLEEKCSKCGFQERRITDYKMPLIMHFKDGDSKHYGLQNVQLLCYNCYFVYYGTVFTEREIETLEGHGSVTMKTEQEVLKMDDYQIKMLRNIGLPDADPEDPYSLVSYK
jgi:hypothetical protein